MGIAGIVYMRRPFPSNSYFIMAFTTVPSRHPYFYFDDPDTVIFQVCMVLCLIGYL